MKRKYFSLVQENNIATINIYGDITSRAWEEYGEMSSNILSKQLEAMGDVNEIHVFLNSYGGEVAEGLAIYNALRRHKAKVVTYCDGFACSIASVIFMAGDERVMNESSLLMIHNAWTYASGNSAELRKIAEDMDKITQASVEAYKAHSVLSEKQIKKMMDAETWILPSEALEYGFATKVDKTENKNANQSAFKQLLNIINVYQKAKSEEEETDDEVEVTTDEEETSTEDGNTSTEDDETTTETDEEPTEDEETENEETKKQKEATQKMSCFFNAILNM